MINTPGSPSLLTKIETQVDCSGEFGTETQRISSEQSQSKGQLSNVPFKNSIEGTNSKSSVLSFEARIESVPDRMQT